LQLERASISTVHAFCSVLLRERPLEAGVDPSFRVLDAFGTRVLQTETWQEWLAGEMEHGPDILKTALRAGLSIKHFEVVRDFLVEQRDCLSFLAEPVASPLPTFRPLFHSGARTTYKVEVARLSEAPDVSAIGASFSALEAKTGAMKQISARDTARGVIGNTSFAVDYSRPLARGRVLLGEVIPYNQVWRTGANAATQFTSSSPITLGGIRVPAGTHTLWTVPRTDGAELIVNRQTGQWGTGYNAAHDLGKARLATDTLATPVDTFTVSVRPGDSRNGTLVIEWGQFRWTAPIVVQ
jgi:hypothetical protein